ncbi:hypothetical protein AVEN_23346-1 [Araneus ventricosus]|uniref:DUF19 domain-containing protein n=1 Tax=Araneus ventricosus TaxID=182803 RepID=A0A4Y2FSS3_ARAVE|nr:hypothetical protein AVEN_23346-1 [Araneus ventricosus]
MESKLSIAVLCFLGLFVVVQGLLLEPKILSKYEKCWTYANCLSSGKDLQTINECSKILRPEEIEPFFQSIHYHYKYERRNLHDATEEYCKIDDAKKPDAYAKSLNGVQACMNIRYSCSRTTDYVDLIDWQVFNVTPPTVLRQISSHELLKMIHRMCQWTAATLIYFLRKQLREL